MNGKVRQLLYKQGRKIKLCQLMNKMNDRLFKSRLSGVYLNQARNTAPVNRVNTIRETDVTVNCVMYIACTPRCKP